MPPTDKPLQDLRRLTGWTQTDLGHYLGRGRATINRWETHMIEAPDFYLRFARVVLSVDDPGALLALLAPEET